MKMVKWIVTKFELSFLKCRLFSMGRIQLVLSFRCWGHSNKTDVDLQTAGAEVLAVP